MIKEKLNGFLTLKDIVYWLAIVGAFIGPYFLHERRISVMATDIAVIKVELNTVKGTVSYTHLTLPTILLV